ncbi:Ppx/GppA family phosphatase [Planococcus lenghuensis]|uniref:Exopolyphosphatase n=1 Tax=Planococcus lenghuensis TaxID=2213202 RepID=A0A1Q2L084_9BACL|nr:Ppx/GppA family phosphatase [Planococcus lenghuensis]AQQ53865.1 exopolyphosphatase [Planococcus lenghuensis]
MEHGKIGVIDIGSNTVRLVIYEHTKERGLDEIQNIKTVARLRTFLDDSMIMAEEGIRRLEEILQSFNEILADFAVTNVYTTATAAVRQASNQQEIISRMEQATGLTIDVLSEEEEAYFGFLAVVHSIPAESGVTIDIGGGSTEITFFQNKKLQHTHSFPFGAVSLKQQFIEEDRLTAANQKKLEAFVTEQFASLPWLQGLGLPVIGIGGSARNVAQIDQEEKHYPISGVHQYQMKPGDLIRMSDRFQGKTLQDMKQVEGLSSDRADIILLAIEVFRILLKTVQANEFIFSRKGLREGIMINAIRQQDEQVFDKHDVFRHSYEELVAEFGVNKEHSEFMKATAVGLYLKCCDLGFFQCNPQDEELIARAASLFSLGEYIDQDGASEHTFYLLANRSIDGLFHKDRVRLALVASYKNKELFSRYAKDFGDWFSDEEIKKYRDFGRLLKFVYALNVSKRQVAREIELVQTPNGFELHVGASGNSMAEEYHAGRQKKHLENFIGQDVLLVFRRLAQSGKEVQR